MLAEEMHADLKKHGLDLESTMLHIFFALVSPDHWQLPACMCGWFPPAVGLFSRAYAISLIEENEQVHHPLYRGTLLKAHFPIAVENASRHPYLPQKFNIIHAMTFFTLGVALIATGFSLAFSLSTLAEKPAWAAITCGCGCVASGWTLIRAGWPTRRSKP